MERRKNVKKSRRKRSPVRKSRKSGKRVTRLIHHLEHSKIKLRKSASKRSRSSSKTPTSSKRPFKIERSNKYWRDSKGDLHPLYAHFMRKDYPVTGRRQYVLWKKGRSSSSPTYHGKFYKS